MRDWEGKCWCMRVDRHVVGVNGIVCEILGFQHGKIGFVMICNDFSPVTLDTWMSVF